MMNLLTVLALIASIGWTLCLKVVIQTATLDDYNNAGVNLSICQWSQQMCVVMSRLNLTQALNTTFHYNCRIKKSLSGPSTIHACETGHISNSWYQNECVKEGFIPPNVTCDSLLAEAYACPPEENHSLVTTRGSSQKIVNVTTVSNPAEVSTDRDGIVVWQALSGVFMFLLSVALLAILYLIMKNRQLHKASDKQTVRPAQSHVDVGVDAPSQADAERGTNPPKENERHQDQLDALLKLMGTNGLEHLKKYLRTSDTIQVDEIESQPPGAEGSESLVSTEQQPLKNKTRSQTNLVSQNGLGENQPPELPLLVRHLPGNNLALQKNITESNELVIMSTERENNAAVTFKSDEGSGALKPQRRNFERQKSIQETNVDGPEEDVRAGTSFDDPSSSEASPAHVEVDVNTAGNGRPRRKRHTSFQVDDTDGIPDETDELLGERSEN